MTNLEATPRRRANARRPCSFEGCDRLNYGGGLCNTHYMQRRRRLELKPVRPPRPEATEGMEWCSNCKQFRDETDFTWDAKREERRYWCRACMTTKELEYNKKAGPGVIAHRKRLRRHGLTTEQFDQLLADQAGKCAICRRPEKLHIDHCHVKQSVRGLLCGPCNRALGMMRDDVAVLQAAIAYLERGT